MNLRTDTEALVDGMPFAEEPDAPIAAWTLDELDHLADLGSVRAALEGSDDCSA